MVTKFGRLVRILRMEKGVLLKDMAEAMGITSSYLSALEKGKKRITDEVLTQVIEYFELSGHKAVELKAAADESQTSATIDLTNATDDAKMLGLTFARKFNALTDEQRKELLKILE